MPFTILLRAVRYCSTFEEYLSERETIRMALLLNKYPSQFIDTQFNGLLQKFGISELLTTNNYATYRQRVINTSTPDKAPVDYGKTMFIHFTYCASMKTLPGKFHEL